MRTMLTVLSAALAQLAIVGSANAYTPEVPTNLAVTMKLTSGTTCSTSLTREVEFVDYQGGTIAVSVTLVQGATACSCTSNPLNATELSDLQSLAALNNRSHWDTMNFVNSGGNVTLSIDQLEVAIEY